MEVSEHAAADQAGQQPEAAAAAGAAAAGGGGGVAMKQRKNRGNMRKRDADSTEAAAAAAADEDTTTVVRKAKQARGEPLAFSTKQDKKQDLAVTYASTAEALAAKDESATRHLESETQFDRDNR
jgi:hypothetical protein